MEGGEPVQLTTFKYGANNPKWSPDGKKNTIQVFHYKNYEKILF
jgi:Tol biopolymer transport system component